jgi:hypothetical protein
MGLDRTGREASYGCGTEGEVTGRQRFGRDRCGVREEMPTTMHLGLPKRVAQP